MLSICLSRHARQPQSLNLSLTLTPHPSECAADSRSFAVFCGCHCLCERIVKPPPSGRIWHWQIRSCSPSLLEFLPSAGHAGGKLGEMEQDRLRRFPGKCEKENELKTNITPLSSNRTARFKSPEAMRAQMTCERCYPRSLLR